jgi:NADPH:quinone reductase-like Zn-dependent oxidoreductase
MRAAGIDRFGAAVRSMTLPDPRPLAPDEVLIQVKAAGVGNWDDLARVGDWDIGCTPPMALGVEAAGVIVAIGERVTRWAPGDQVITHAPRRARTATRPAARRTRHPGRLRLPRRVSRRAARRVAQLIVLDASMAIAALAAEDPRHQPASSALAALTDTDLVIAAATHTEILVGPS